MTEIELNPTLSNVLTPKSYLESHVDYASNLTDAPMIYHKILALNNLSLAIGRTPIKISPYKLYPNLDIIIVGLSGVAHKSTALRLGLDILPDDLKNSLPNAFSPEALQEALSEHPQGLLYIDEIGGLLESIKKRDYMSGMADLLCQLFDCPDVYCKRLRGKTFTLKYVCFNTVSATTPSRFLDTVKPSDFSSGFISRKLVVIGVRTKTLSRRKIDPIDEKRLKDCRGLWQRLYDYFHQKDKAIDFVFEDDALAHITSWCDAKDAEVLSLDNAHEADLKGAISARMQDYAFKLSALFEVDTLSANYVSSVSGLVVSRGLNATSTIHISLESAQKACSLIDYLLTQLTNNLLTKLTTNGLDSNLTKLANVIKSKAEIVQDGWVQHRIVLQYTNFTADTLKKLVDTARQRELIEQKVVGKAMYYRIKTSDKHPAILKETISEEVIR